MQITAIVDSSVFDEALRAARAREPVAGIAPGALYANLSDEGQRWTDTLWGSVEHVLRLAWEQGKAAARTAMDILWAQVDEMRKKLGRRAAEVQDAVLAEVGIFVRKFVNGALARVQQSVTIGTFEYPIQSITVEQKLKISGSLKVSLEGVCEFLSEGELTLSASYAIPAQLLPVSHDQRNSAHPSAPGPMAPAPATPPAT